MATAPMPDRSGETQATSETTSFPAFLDTDPFPSTAPDGRPDSSSSAVTDGLSEYGAGDYASARERQSNIPSTTGPVGEPGLPPSRPTSVGASATSSQRGAMRSSGAPATSRRGLAAFAPKTGGGHRNSAEAGGQEDSGSAVSKTHVPSLTAQGFFRPMSSQQLQAQRGQGGAGAPATSSLAQNVQTNSRRSEDSTVRHRYSNASVNTLRDGLPPTRDEDAPPLPISRGTMFTQDGTHNGSTTQLDGQTAASVVSNNSTAPLHARQRNGGGPLKLETSGLKAGTPPKSPGTRSLRASLRLNPRHASTQNQHERRPSPNGHEKLHSEPTTPADAEKPGEVPFSPVQLSQKGVGKNYEYFAGNMLFFLAGRCLNTKARPLNVMTFILTALPAGLFFGFSAPWLWHNVSPAVPIIFAYFIYITISSFLHAAFSDPGIMPRNLHPHPVNPEEERDPLTVGPPTTEWIMVKTFPSKRTPAAQSSPEEAGQRSGATTAMEVPTKYCKSCAIWRPPRAHHCRVCDACIESQDHHCVWLNNCVGRRNYRYFFSYVGWASVCTLMLLAFSLTHVIIYAHRHHIGFRDSLTGRTQERVAFAMFIYSVLALPYPGSLFAYHVFLTARGETTREYLNSHKFLPKDRHRPFSQSSVIRNWIAVLIRPRGPNYLEFKKKYVEGDVRLGHTQRKKVRKAEMKGRYAVGKSGGGGKEGTEMKAMSPSRPQTGLNPQGRGSGAGGVGAAAGGMGGVGVNNTPR